MTRRRPHFHLVQSHCRRCGKALFTGNRSLVGTPDMKARYAEICADCFTPDEYEAMDQDFRHLLFDR